MGKKTSWFTLTTTQCKEIENVGMRSGWKLLSQESLPSVLPSDFRKKLVSRLTNSMNKSVTKFTSVMNEILCIIKYLKKSNLATLDVTYSIYF
jgi:hypothetical protein